MDQRRILTDDLLRKTLPQQNKPFEPLLFTERTMRAVRQAHRRNLRRERLIFLLPVAIGFAVLLGMMIWCGIRLAHQPDEPISRHDLLIGFAVLCGALLYLLQDILCRLWKIPK